MTIAHVHPAALPDWTNIAVIHRNALPPRANFHLYDSADKALTRDLSKSRAQKLSGPDTKWQLHVVKSPFDGPSGFHAVGFDVSEFKDVAVPGMWQLQGFGRGPQYTNVIFPFPVNPPYVPYDQNECGRYVTKFTVNKGFVEEGGQLRLRFEGVDSSFKVWVNGNEVGYSQGSRNPSEFDVTKLVKLGSENELKVEVYQFCNGSYLEDQDQWWLSGIFRDVYLHSFPKTHIEDFQVHTLLDDDYKDVTFKVDVQLNGNADVSLLLLDVAGKEVVSLTQTVDKKGTLETKLSNPLKWTAETPNLYTLVLGIPSSNSHITQRIGFRRTELIKGVYCINGKPVKFRGVNRHEHHPESGRAVPYEFLKADLLLMKTHNINAIRTSHQINDVRLYDLCDELGLWIIDEADLECHGFGECGQGDPWTPEKFASDNPEWAEQYVDRAKQMVHRDKNHPCIVIWSLGNEAFFGRNHEKMYDYIRSVDQSRLVHYEQDYNARTVDIYSRMYASVDSIIQFAQEENWTKPLVLCEFIHAMGNSPGGGQEYIEAFYKYPRLMGGFVWEWANHGLKTKNADGEEYMGYGGDFGEEIHDGRFVMDGLLFANHTPSPGITEYGKLIEPVQTLRLEGNKVTIINRYDFIGFEHLRCTWKIVTDGQTTEGQEVQLPKDAKPHTESTIIIDGLPDTLSSEAYLKLEFTLKEKTAWADAGHLVAWGQLPLSKPTSLSTIKSLASPATSLSVDDTVPQVVSIRAADGTKWTFNPVHGVLNSWIRPGSGKNIITSPPTMGFYRPMTDNDRGSGARNQWIRTRLHQTRDHIRKVTWRRNKDVATCSVVVEGSVMPPVLAWSIDTTTTYTFGADGSVSIKVKGKPRGFNPPNTLARIGYTIGLDGVEAVEWFGRGPGEGYRDKKQAQSFGTWSSSVDDLFVDYECPQDGGQRTDVRWVSFNSSSKDRVLRARFGDLEGASFNATRYTAKDIDAAAHPYELHKNKRKDAIVRLDFAHHGIGTASCGPDTLPQYELRTEEFEYEVLLD